MDSFEKEYFMGLMSTLTCLEADIIKVPAVTYDEMLVKDDLLARLGKCGVQLKHFKELKEKNNEKSNSASDSK